MVLTQVFFNPDFSKVPHVIITRNDQPWGVLFNCDVVESPFGLQNVKDGVVDHVNNDPPYNTTAEGWDTSILPISWMRREYMRVTKPGGVVTVTGSDFFIHNFIRQFSIIPAGNKGATYEANLHKLVNLAAQKGVDSTLLEQINETLPVEEVFKYMLIWEKLSHPGNVLHSKNRPLVWHEYVAVFSRGKIKKEALDNDESPRMVYYPYGAVFKGTVENYSDPNHMYLGRRITTNLTVETYTNMPGSILHAAKDRDRTVASTNSTSKPTALIEKLIGMYSQEDEIVIDPTAGSGTVPYVALSMDRQFIAWERDPEQFERIAQWVTEVRESATNPFSKLASGFSL